MKLKEKFERYVLEKDFFGDNVQEKYTIGCEKIADDYAIDFVCWLMDNCKLISTEEEENVLWRYESEDYIIDTLLEIFKKEKGW